MGVCGSRVERTGCLELGSFSHVRTNVIELTRLRIESGKV